VKKKSKQQQKSNWKIIDISVNECIKVSTRSECVPYVSRNLYVCLLAGFLCPLLYQRWSAGQRTQKRNCKGDKDVSRLML